MTGGRVALLAFAAISTASAVAAQITGPANPGRVGERFTQPPTSQSVPPLSIPAPEQAPPPLEAAKTRFVIHHVVIDGSTAFRPEALGRFYASLIDKDDSLLDVYQLRDAITAKYRAAGYILSQAIIPPQKIADGVVHIQVIEGYVSAVKLEGEVRDPRGLIRAMADRITRSRPLRVRDLERYTLLIGDLPGVQVRTVLRPSPDQPGASELILLIKRDPFAGRLEADNRGSVAIGPVQSTTELNGNSLLGLDEQTTISAATVSPVRELYYASVRHDEYLTPEGLKLSLSATNSEAHPEGQIAPLDAYGRNATYSVRLSEPVIRSRTETVTLGAAFTVLDAKTDLLGALYSDDHLRIVSFDATLDKAETWLGDKLPATDVIYAQISHGLDALGASPAGAAYLSRADGGGAFTKFDAQATRVQTLLPQWSLAVAATGQFSDNSLLTSQQFGLGGAEFGRGYEPSELTGDKGAGGSVELRYSPAILPALSPQLYGFYEVGIVWLNAPLSREENGASLASAGGGVRFSLTHNLTADVELAKPLTRPIASRGNKNVRPLFAVTTSL
jgi:hemolysin activation/secretion protein